MEKRIIVMAVLVALFSFVFSMSGDGGNVPVDQKKEAGIEILQDNPQDNHAAKNVYSEVNDKHVPESMPNITGKRHKYSDPTPKEKWSTRAIYNSEGIYASELLKSPDQPDDAVLESHYKAYKEKFIKLGMNTIEFVPTLYYHKVNLNAIDELKKIGIDLLDLDKRHFKNFNDIEEILKTQVYIIGEVVEINYDSIPSSRFRSIYTVRVDEILKGAEFYNDNLPKYVKVYGFEGPGLNLRGYNLEYKKGYQIKHGFSKIHSECYKDNDAYKIDAKTIKSTAGEYFSIDLLNSLNFIQSNKIFDKEFIIKYEQINDTRNFFKKEFWKWKQYFF